MNASERTHGPEDVAPTTPSIAEPAPARRMKSGPLFALTNLAAATILAGTLIAIHGLNVPGLFEVTGALTKISFLMFLAAFIAHPLHDLLGNRVTAWMMANRRYLGLSFAAWHLPHWPIIAGFLTMMGPALFWKTFGHLVVPATTVLIIITLLAATSTNAAQRFLGKSLWGALHSFVIYTIWVWFLKIYLGRVHTSHPYVTVYIALMLSCFVLRVAMLVRRRLKKRAA